MRLDKYLADCGFGSRSQVKTFLKKGLVSVNGRVEKDPEAGVTPGSDQILCSGRDALYQDVIWYMMHKPAGVVTARSDRRCTAVLDLIRPEDALRRVLSPVGRLDIDTTGLLLITDDGAMSHRLLSPSSHVEKEYEAELSGSVTDAMIRAFREGMDIGDSKLTKPADLILVRQDQDRALVRIILHEGRYHQIKRMAHSAGCEVLSLKRLRMGPVSLDPALSPGMYRPLTEEERSALYAGQNRILKT